ncbi:hypothetical protein M434DRAFT_10249 [Hypoxylon sp. CO27-5]|nr:hypothetical protein M434DRAFT_10249 [Hypoxylon sp. CO27-5]
MALVSTARELGERLGETYTRFEKHQTPSNTRANLMALPVELRNKIYEELYYVYDDYFDELKMAEWGNSIEIWENHRDLFALLRVCKQAYSDVIHILFRTILLRENSGSFLKRFSPKIFSLIQHVIFDYNCPYYFRYALKWECDYIPEQPFYWTHHHDTWGGYYDKLASAGLNPKDITIRITPCDAYIDEFEGCICYTYWDLTFLKFIGSRFANVRQISLKGVFNPLWGFALKKRLGFTIKRDDPEMWCLVNPKYYYSTVGYTQSSINGVYDKIQIEDDKPTDGQEEDDEPIDDQEEDSLNGTT